MRCVSQLGSLKCRDNRVRVVVKGRKRMSGGAALRSDQHVGFGPKAGSSRLLVMMEDDRMRPY